MRESCRSVLSPDFPEGDVDLLNGDYWDPHAIAGLLKTYLRDLPESLLTRDLHMSFLSVIGECCASRATNLLLIVRLYSRA